MHTFICALNFIFFHAYFPYVSIRVYASALCAFMLHILCPFMASLILVCITHVCTHALICFCCFFVSLEFQNYLRTQDSNSATINVVVCTVDYLLRLQVCTAQLMHVVHSFSLCICIVCVYRSGCIFVYCILYLSVCVLYGESGTFHRRFCT